MPLKMKTCSIPDVSHSLYGGRVTPCSAGFQPAVSPISNRQTVRRCLDWRMIRRLEPHDIPTGREKSALPRAQAFTMKYPGLN